MKNKILNEINRVREIMGVGRLLVEQGRLVTRITKIAAKEADTAAGWFRALRKAIKEEPKYKKFGDKIPLRVILNDLDLLDAVELIISNQTKMTRVAGKGKTMGQQFRAAGLDISDDAALTLGKGYNSSGNIDGALDALQRANVDKLVTDLDITKIFSKSGKRMSKEIQPITDVLTDIFEDIGVKSSDDINKFLKDINLPSDDVKRITQAIAEGGDISTVGDIKKIFSNALDNTNYRADIIDSIQKNSKTWKKYVQNQGWDISSVAELLGRDIKDPLVKDFYSQLAKENWFKVWFKKSAKATFFGPTALKIYKWIAISVGIGTFLNFLLGRKYLTRGKQREALSPQMYMDIITNKEMVKREGGYTDDEAKAAAKKIKRALDGEGTIGVNDTMILEVYEAIPTILASSQVTYWYEQLFGPGTLKTALEGMRFSPLISPAISDAFGDITDEDVFDELKTKKWCETCTQKGKSAAYEKRVRQSWPRYLSVLSDDSGTEEIEYFSRLKGPIDVQVLGALLEFCDPETSSDMEDCLNNMSPLTFNEAWAGVYPEDPLGDPYSPNYDPDEVKDTTNDWIEGFRNIVDGDEDGGQGESLLDKIRDIEIK